LIRRDLYDKRHQDARARPRDEHMTEAEWLAGKEPLPMLEFLRGKVSDRKMRLFACAYGRAVRESQHLLGPSTAAVGERFADGLASEQDLTSARRQWAITPEEIGPVHASAYQGAWEAVAWLTDVQRIMKIDPDEYRHFPIPTDAVLQRAAALLRDIFGNPFQPLSLSLTILQWNESTIVKLAQAIYEERTFDRLPILADALLDAGCDHADILNHCRQPGVHVRGCWVVDLLLGKK
jgi:hypothetical protein